MLRNPSPLESAIERSFMRLMKEHFPEIRVRKMNGEGYRSWPDRMVCIPGGRPLLIEFKRPGRTLTEGQNDLHGDLRALGYLISTHTSARTAFDAVRNAIELEAVDRGG
jgi:hypothetical protein